MFHKPGSSTHCHQGSPASKLRLTFHSSAPRTIRNGRKNNVNNLLEVILQHLCVVNVQFIPLPFSNENPTITSNDKETERSQSRPGVFRMRRKGCLWPFSGEGYEIDSDDHVSSENRTCHPERVHWCMQVPGGIIFELLSSSCSILDNAVLWDLCGPNHA